MNVVPDEAVLREHLTSSTAWVKEQLRRADIGCNFTLKIEIEGPIQGEEGCKLTYNLDHTRNYQSSVTGNSLAAVTWELLRRSGWAKEHQGLQLTWNGAGAPSLAENE